MSARRQSSNKTPPPFRIDRCLDSLLFAPTFDSSKEAPVNGQISETILGAYPCSGLDVRRASRLGVQAAVRAVTKNCLVQPTSASYRVDQIGR